jgi:hypothetical protein
MAASQYEDLMGKHADEQGRTAQQVLEDVLVGQVMAWERVADLNAVYREPDRAEADRIQHTYNRQVVAVAWAQGNQENVFLWRFRDLMAERRDAEEFDDTNDLRRIDAKLERLVGVPYPQLPTAAWEAADQLPESERLAEYERLEIKYGPRNLTSNGAGKTKARCETRPFARLETRR